MYYESRQFPFVASLEEHYAAIRAEFSRLGPSDLMPWPERGLYGSGWTVFGLHAFGQRIAMNCARCPVTSRLVEQVPGLKSAGFSALAPGTRIAPHEGYSRAVLRCHLGLLVPARCALRVGTEERRWEEGRCLVFDDTVEHEAWNLSDRMRVVLLLDFQRPARARE